MQVNKDITLALLKVWKGTEIESHSQQRIMGLAKFSCLEACVMVFLRL